MKEIRNIHPSSHIEDGVFIHETAAIGPNCYLRGKISIAAHVDIKGGVTLVGNIVVGENAILEPGVCIAADRPENGAINDQITVGPHAHLGAGCILRQGVSIGTHAWVEPGSVLLRNIPPHAIVAGNPAIITGYLRDKSQPKLIPPIIVDGPDNPGVYTCQCQGVEIHSFNRIRDLRGDLTVGEFEKNIPFTPKRYFIVFDVPSSETRGEHAHKRCHQFLICPSGTVSVVVDDGIIREEILLDKPNMGLLIPAGIWAIQYRYSNKATLLVFASEHYDPCDYIRNYDEFIEYRQAKS